MNTLREPERGDLDLGDIMEENIVRERKPTSALDRKQSLLNS